MKALVEMEVARAAVQALADRTIERLQHDGWITDASLNARAVDTLRTGYWQFGFKAYKRTERASGVIHPKLAWGISLPTVFAGVCFRRDGGGPVTPAKDAARQSALLELAGWDEEANPAHKALVWVTKSTHLPEIIGSGLATEQVITLSEFVAGAFDDAGLVRRTATK